MLELPSGQIPWSSDGRPNNGADCTADVEVYTPDGSPNSSWKPVISSAPSSVTRGGGGGVSGTLLMGLSQGAAYGDDAQMATNYPIITITNSQTGDICFATTSYWYPYGSIDWVNSEIITSFAVPQNCETGASQLIVVANGITSDPWAVQVN